MAKLMSALALAMLSTLNACGDTMEQYEKSGVEIISVQHALSGGAEITYRPMLDSMYFCPGVTVRHDGGRTKVSFVRCKIKERCAVDIASERQEAGQWKIALPVAPAQIDLVFSDGEATLGQ